MTVPDATESADAAEGPEGAETLEPLSAEGHHNPRTIPLSPLNKNIAARSAFCRRCGDLADIR